MQLEPDSRFLIEGFVRPAGGKIQSPIPSFFCVNKGQQSLEVNSRSFGSINVHTTSRRPLFQHNNASHASISHSHRGHVSILVVVV
jgi:hypothetical protein